MSSPLLNTKRTATNGSDHARFSEFQSTRTPRKREKQTNEQRLNMNHIKTTLLRDMMKDKPKESLFYNLAESTIKLITEDSAAIKGTLLI